MRARLNLELPDFLSAEEARTLLAVKLFEVGRVSLGQAAKIAGFSKRSFMELLGRQGVAVFNQSADALENDLRCYRAGRLLELAGSGLWEGRLSEMRDDTSPRPEPR